MRNDRFVTAVGPLCDLFPEADFVECHFTKHLITKLITIDAARADIVFRAPRRMGPQFNDHACTLARENYCLLV